MPKVGFLTVDEYRNRSGSADHRLCETPRHDWTVIKAVAVIIIAQTEYPQVFGVCAECFAQFDNDLGPEANWHLTDSTSPESE